MSRGGLKITRHDNSEFEKSERVDWIDTFARNIDKASKDPRNAVEAARMRDQQNLLDQIRSIVSKQPRYSSVEEAVRDYQERTGLKEWLRSSAQEENNSSVKTANSWPENLNKIPVNLQEDIQNFVRNKIETYHGNTQVPAIVQEVLQTFQRRGLTPQDVYQPAFEKYVSDQIIEGKKNNPTSPEFTGNLGKGVGTDVDQNTNSDMFESLMPAKG